MHFKHHPSLGGAWVCVCVCAPWSISPGQRAWGMCPVAANKAVVTEWWGGPSGQTKRQCEGRAVHPTRRDAINLAQSNSRNVPVCQKQIPSCLGSSLGRKRASHLVKQTPASSTQTKGITSSIARPSQTVLTPTLPANQQEDTEHQPSATHNTSPLLPTILQCLQNTRRRPRSCSRSLRGVQGENARRLSADTGP